MRPQSWQRQYWRASALGLLGVALWGGFPTAAWAQGATIQLSARNIYVDAGVYVLLAGAAVFVVARPSGRS